MNKLSLEDLERFDPTAPRSSGSERKFCCPLPGCSGKPIDASHRKLYANLENRAWFCHRCGERGRLWEPQQEDRLRVNQWSVSNAVERPEGERVHEQIIEDLDAMRLMAAEYRREGDPELADTVLGAVSAIELSLATRDQ